MDISASNVTELHKGPESLYHLARDMPFDCWDIDLHMINMIAKTTDGVRIYLHEGLGIISGPLFKSPAFRELLQTRKRSCCCNTA
jgi:hypothetical protein